METYFPLEEGRLYNYAISANGSPGMLVSKVHRTDASHGELRSSSDTQRFVYSAEGVAKETGAFLLKAPLEVGKTWPGEHGGTTRVATTDAAPKVLAGTYSSCVQTIEEGGAVPGAKYASTYCPGVGLVLLEVTAPGNDIRAELKSYGFPVKIE